MIGGKAEFRGRVLILDILPQSVPAVTFRRPEKEKLGSRILLAIGLAGGEF